jgi:hypothetical protein
MVALRVGYSMRFTIMPANALGFATIAAGPAFDPSHSHRRGPRRTLTGTIDVSAGPRDIEAQVLSLVERWESSGLLGVRQASNDNQHQGTRPCWPQAGTNDHA